MKPPAMARLRAIGAAEARYGVESGGEYGTLDQLIQNRYINDPSSGKLSGYRFEIKVKPGGFQVTAVPENSASPAHARSISTKPISFVAPIRKAPRQRRRIRKRRAKERRRQKADRQKAVGLQYRRQSQKANFSLIIELPASVVLPSAFCHSMPSASSGFNRRSV